MLLVDQFEELFRFGTLGGDVEVHSFLDQLIDVFDGQPRGIHIVSTMRADFKILDRVTVPDAPERNGGTLVVEAGRPGASVG